MRRVLVLLLVAAAVAVGAGLSIPADAVKSGSTTLPGTELSRELWAVHNSGPWQCYLQAKAYVLSTGTKDVPGVDGVSATSTWNADFGAYWSSLRIQQLAEYQYVLAHDPGAFDQAHLVAAKKSLEDEIIRYNAAAASGQVSQSVPYSCSAASTGSATLAPSSLPAWFVDQQVQGEAAYLGLAALAPGYLDVTDVAALEAYYNHHRALFAKKCVSVILPVNAAGVAPVVKALNHGMAFADAARKFSVDTTKSKGGTVGCFSAGDYGYSVITGWLGPLKVGHWRVTTDPSSGQVFFVHFDSLQTPDFAGAKSSVASVVQTNNVAGATRLAIEVLHATDVWVDPAVGVWVDSTSGGSVAPPPAPSIADTLNPIANQPPVSTYSPQSTGSPAG